MATSFEAMQAAGGSEFQLRVKFFATKAAIAIMAESAGTANHAERVVWANAEIAGENSTGQQSYSVSTNSTIQADIDSSPGNGVSDGDMEFTVNSMVNAWAGVSA